MTRLTYAIVTTAAVSLIGVASIASFALYVVGEGMEKRTNDFAAEVAAQAAAAQK